MFTFAIKLEQGETIVVKTESGQVLKNDALSLLTNGAAVGDQLIVFTQSQEQ